MLKTRIITALVLLAVLLPALFLNYFPVFAAVLAVFFAAAVWESFRLFGHKRPLLVAAFWTAAFAYTFLHAGGHSAAKFWLALSLMIWLLRFAPTLKFGLPPLDGMGNVMLSLIYAVTLVGCFVAILTLYLHSATYLLSAMALVWIADIGAYFAGKAFGKRKLAPSISPGKSWEGAIGGWIAVLALSALSIVPADSVPLLADTFAVKLQAALGWFKALAVLTVIVIASVVGDLFESQLKRRAGMKDSSTLLPGHGGVLDRIDALVPALPVAALVSAWL
ncbi:phosphatidate cytidylyltransferase [Massilia sp. erpn]|uniref:phosphatidate cytidylyltransferase n=1 Tax=Massilia sp. erpn TaxID=2738142 RepID=UPI0021046FB0|nr:phosphatidate cytidylyltransferase [Massilia sp. erpn]UTY59212.1 phosphatidate cytidylyltransferase [Massilia sp. erpn]